MSKKANPALVGGFVLGALALAVVAVMIFGSGRLFHQTERYVLYFQGSMTGLDVGSPVVFRGVEVGNVVDIRIEFDDRNLTFRIPVIIEIFPERFSRSAGMASDAAQTTETNGGNIIDRMVRHGLCAQLQLQSFVTGQLLILIDIFPNRPSRLVQVKTPYPQLPTTPSNLEQLTRTLEKFPINEIATKLVATLEGIERFVNSPELGDTLQEVGATLAEIKRLAHSMGESLSGANQKLTVTLESAQTLLTHLDEQLQPLAAQWSETARAGQNAMEKTGQAMSTVEQAVNGDSNLRFQLENALTEIAAAARSLRTLSDYLDRHPDALLRGKQGNQP